MSGFPWFDYRNARLHGESVQLDDIARQFGTPCYVYSRAALVAAYGEFDAAFATNCDPLTGKYPRDPLYDRLFTRIVSRAPAPIGLGD